MCMRTCFAIGPACGAVEALLTLQNFSHYTFLTGGGVLKDLYTM